ncbi:unnamed protein product [Psylliodes chrysocephalus]|uniref:Icarapin-like n=1 Tax=Psylliodes chrysocephalus TaxID=3402493 RepID=A0A9P0CNC0_9CUCU|nr:unnamed protein product [Psylliodes chrysocephala]
MRRFVIGITVLGFLWCVAALPATSKQIDDGIEFVNPKQPYGDQPIVDTSAGFDEGSFSNPFGGLFENLENMMVRVRQQMNDLLNRFPGIRNGNSSGDLPDFPRIGDFPRLDIDLGKGNTTSVTKIIDGHKVVINQTEYHKDDELGSSFFKVRIIDVQPQVTATEKDAEEVKPISTVSKDRESVENTVENEILKNKEATLYQQQSIENFDFVDSPSRFVPRFVPMEANSNWNDFSRIEPIDDNSLDFEPIRDLSRDTYVNEIMANSGATMNPDAELIEVVPYKSNIVPIGDNGVNFKPI